jgi:hypothetical protein
MLSRRQVGVFFEVFRLKRFRNGVLAAEPFAEVNQFAAMRTERPVFSGEPIAFLFAGWTSNRSHRSFMDDLQSMHDSWKTAA